MIEYTRQEAALRMNDLGQAGRPFLFIIDYAGRQAYVESPEAVDREELLFDFDGFTNCPPVASPSGGRPFVWRPSYLPKEAYARSFRIVSDQIHAGNSYLVNLTCATPVRTDLSLREIFARSRARYRLWMRDRLVVFSPEIFVRIRGGYIYSYPMKGTIDASRPGARACILADPKETAEHATIVDLIRNDLSQVATEVCVPRYRYIDELRTHAGRLLQVSSEVRGRVADDWRQRVGDLLFQLLPAGSITGAPKRKTMEIIRQAETHERGFYTGVMGYFDGERLDSAVMIRFVERAADGSFLFKSGGGITSRSDMEAEYNEMKQKVYVPIY